MSDQISQRVLVAVFAASVAALPEGAIVTLNRLAEATGLDRKAINNAVQRLCGRGFIAIVKPGEYRLTDAGRAWVESGRRINGGQGRRYIQRTSGLRERGWWLMRELRRFTLPDLLTTLASGEERDAHSNLRKYISVLERAGVLVRMKRRVACPLTPEGLVMWRLARDLGRAAPVHRQRHGVVFDPNGGEVLALTPSSERKGERREEARHDPA